MAQDGSLGLSCAPFFRWGNPGGRKPGGQESKKGGLAVLRKQRIGLSRMAAIFLAAALCLLPSACTLTPTGHAGSARDKLLDYYEQLGEDGLTSQTQALVLLAAGESVSQETVQRLIPVSDQALPVDTLCGAVYLAEASRLDSRSYRGKNLVSLLSGHQMADGSFGFLEQTVRAAMTLENVGASYDREGVIRLLISAQRPDGGFCAEEGGEADLALTGLTLSLLTCFEDDYRAQTMLERAVEYLAALAQALPEPPPDCGALSAVICGLADAGQDLSSERWSAFPQALLDCQTEDDTFAAQPGQAFDQDATALALAALEAMHSGKSWWNSVIVRSGVVSLSVQAGEEVICEVSRFVLQEQETALSLLGRFCAANGLEVQYQMGAVLSIGQHEASAAQGWQLFVNGELSPEDRILAPGDEVVWKFS